MNALFFQITCALNANRRWGVGLKAAALGFMVTRLMVTQNKGT